MAFQFSNESFLFFETSRLADEREYCSQEFSSVCCMTRMEFLQSISRSTRKDNPFQKQRTAPLMVMADTSQILRSSSGTKSRQILESLQLYWEVHTRGFFDVGTQKHGRAINNNNGDFQHSIIIDGIILPKVPSVDMYFCNPCVFKTKKWWFFLLAFDSVAIKIEMMTKKVNKTHNF